MHEGLYEQLCSQQVLLQAWEKIKTKGSAGGIDRVSVEMFEDGLNSNINSLAEQLSSGHYIPEPYQEIKVPKDDGEHRCLSLPTIKDKIVQCAVKDLMEPLLEKQFLDVSYAYRPGKGTERAIAMASHLIVTEKRQWATVCDIDNYFDTVDHALLLEMLSGTFAERDLVRLVSLWVKMGRVDQNGSWKPMKQEFRREASYRRCWPISIFILSIFS
jgi:retron-type reverse transcriptase